MVTDKLRVGVVGAGRWAKRAHIPGWLRDPRCEVVALCDLDGALARERAREFGVPESTDDWQALVGRRDIDVSDVVTSGSHFEPAWAALEAGKHVLCEKPVNHDYRKTRAAADLARSKGVKTKLGFTFRYSPGVKYAWSMICEGFVGKPFIYNAYEQNSQFLDPMNPIRRQPPEGDQSVLHAGALEGYGAPVIDIGHWWVGADYTRVVGTLHNFVPERMVRSTGQLTRMNIEDGNIFLGEFANGVLSSVQSSTVTVGNYPGIEVRLYGDKGAIICRLVEEFGIAETIKIATPDSVEFKEIEIPQKFYPTGGHAREGWDSLFYANLIADFIDEIREGGRNQGNFDDGAWVQEVINAVEISHWERRWVDLPL